MIVEGEKDVDRLRTLKWPATCNSEGAGKWHDAHTQALVAAGVKHVIIIPDTDVTGRAHAQAVAARCHASGIAVKVVTLPDGHKDVSDYLDNGGSVTTLDDTVHGGAALGAGRRATGRRRGSACGPARTH